MTTWGDLQTEINDALQNDIMVYWQADELLRYGNRVCNEIAKRTKHKRKALVFSLLAGVGTYTWASLGVTDLLEIIPESVIFNQNRTLELYTMADMPSQWETETSAEPHGFLLDINGMPGITVYPKPSADVLALAAGEGLYFNGEDGGVVLDIVGLEGVTFAGEFGAITDMRFYTGGVKLFYKAATVTPMTGNTSVPDIPTGHEEALTNGVLMMAYRKDGPIESPKMSDYYRGLFEQALAEIQEVTLSDFGTGDRPAQTYAF